MLSPLKSMYRALEKASLRPEAVTAESSVKESPSSASLLDTSMVLDIARGMLVFEDMGRVSRLAANT